MHTVEGCARSIYISNFIENATNQLLTKTERSTTSKRETNSNERRTERNRKKDRTEYTHLLALVHTIRILVSYFDFKA